MNLENKITPAAEQTLDMYGQKMIRLLEDMIAEAHTKNLDAPPAAIVHFPSRLELAFSYFEPKLKGIFNWLFSSREPSNFTYSITEANITYLVHLISVVTQIPTAQLRQYASELQNDTALKNHVRHLTSQSGRYMGIDPNFDFGRRLGWYVLVRAQKPALVIETGVEQGLGSLVLCSALLRNAAEGAPGRYIGTDINPNAGYLLQDQWATVGAIRYGDSITTLKSIQEPVDFFINDSDHSAQYEWNEYLSIAPKLSSKAIVLGDNAHVTDKLAVFAEQTGRKFLYFQERPENHWYPGAGIGIAYS